MRKGRGGWRVKDNFGSGVGMCCCGVCGAEDTAVSDVKGKRSGQRHNELKQVGWGVGEKAAVNGKGERVKGGFGEKMVILTNLFSPNARGGGGGQGRREETEVCTLCWVWVGRSVLTRACVLSSKNSPKIRRKPREAKHWADKNSYAIIFSRSTKKNGPVRGVEREDEKGWWWLGVVVVAERNSCER